MTSRLSAIMVSYHTGPVLFEALSALLNADRINDIWLIDNGNPAQDRAALIAFRERSNADARLHIVQGHGNIGFAAACNYAVALSDADDLLFINPDAIVSDQAVARLQDTLREAAAMTLIGGCIRDQDGREQRGGRRGPLTLKSALLDRRPGLRTASAEGYDRSSAPLPDAPVPMPVISGAFFMIRRDDFLHVGGFDEAYFLHVEDIDLCDRVWSAGGKVVFHPQAVATHIGATSDTSALSVQGHKLRGMLRYFWRSGGWVTKVATVLAAPLLAAALLLCGVIASTR